MSRLDPIRPPKSRKFAISLIVAVAVFLGMIVSMSWWYGAESWKAMSAAGVSAVAGLALARAFFASMK